MKTIVTLEYSQLLTNWLEQNFAKPKGKVFQVDISLTDTEMLPVLLEEILLHKNPITKSRHIVSKRIKKSLFAPLREEIKAELLQFLEHNDTINLDGYVTFRMDRYSFLINKFLYNIVSSNKG